MKFLLTVLLCIVLNPAWGQAFEQDWKDLSMPAGWTMKCGEDTTPYLGKRTQGTLIFANRKDPSLTVAFHVYYKTDMDSAFRKAVHQWMIVQDCGDFTDKQINFMSFDFRQYYYLLVPCHRCHTSLSEACGQMARQLFNYILGKQ